MAGLLLNLFRSRRSGKVEISNNRRRDKNVRASIAIMTDMPETRPRPLPKPRARERPKSVDIGASVNQSANFTISSSLPNNKPPIIKPKPAGYKQLDFNRKGLVTIKADIEIGDASFANSESSDSVKNNEVFEKNNNVANLKHGNGKRLIGNGLKADAKEKQMSSSGVQYAKPLPPLPKEKIHSSSATDVNAKSQTDIANTFNVLNLPRKPPRLSSSVSDTQICSNQGKKHSTEKHSSDGTANKRRNPALPRKPTCLRKSVALEEMQNSTFYVDSAENENIIYGDTEKTSVKSQSTISLKCDSHPKERCLHTALSDSQLGKLPKSSSYLKPDHKGVSNVGCTPPLPRKPARTPLLAANQAIDSFKNKDSERPLSPNEKRTLSTPFQIETDIKCDDREAKLPDKTGSVLDENKRMPNSKREDNNNEQKTSETKRPHNRPPPPPNQQGPPRRPPPGLPKQPSIEKRRRSEAPPLPSGPRPVSIARENALKMPNFHRRSLSEGNIIDAVEGEDSVYSEAYDHFRDSRCSTSSTKDDTNENAEYESPDQDVVKEFMENRRQKSQSDVRKNENNAVREVKETTKKTRKVSTYSSSSDDSEHEYVEPLSPTPEKRTTKALPSPTNTVSSGSSSNYVEAIHVSQLIKTETLESTTGKYEFKPFSDMDNEWSETKVIDWEYEGESDESDASYVEPDAEDDLDDFDDGDDEAFVEEPLYQIYQAVALEKERTLSLKRSRKSGSSGGSSTTRERTFTLGYGTLRGGKMLWSQLPEVRSKGLLENISSEQRKLQEAIFEVITSEASYLKSLKLLVNHFINSQEFSSDSNDPVLDKNQTSALFSNIMEIVNVSERFLDDLRSRQRQSVLIESISDIITNYATNQFKAYVDYCSSQYKQDRALTNLRKTNWRFSEALDKLERDSCVFGLTLQSFLVLPMQRVTRYPLLVDAIVRRCEPGHKEYYKTDNALKCVNEIVYKCNEGARKEERREEMMQLEKVIKFLKMNPIKLGTDDRWLTRRGPIQLLEDEKKSTLGNTLRGRFKKYRVKPIYLFLFSDLLIVTKKKSDTVYSVIDYAKRNMIRIQEATSKATNAFLLVFLENYEKKTKELSVRADNETDLTRWKEAFEPPSASREDEKIYSTWDCPQVQALHDYQAQQSDELTLVPGDVVNVLRKLPDGWYEGERIRDGICGWFPANHTEEIRNEHVRARNLHQRYRLLAASTAFLDTKKR